MEDSLLLMVPKKQVKLKQRSNMSKIKQYMNQLAEDVISHSSNVEIERKFLITNDSWKKEVSDMSEIYQLYISAQPAVRVRTRNGEATLTIKSANGGMTRSEFEYNIPHQDAVDMFEVFGDNVITKIRYIVKDSKTGHTWEIDEFRGHNSGLVVAEIELSSEDEAVNTDPAWLGDEVTEDPKYYNSYLSDHPYKDW